MINNKQKKNTNLTRENLCYLWIKIVKKKNKLQAAVAEA